MTADSSSPLKPLRPGAAPSEAPDSRKRWLLATACLLLAYGAVGLSTFLDYGITFDEHWHAIYGDDILRWYTSGFQEDRALTNRNLSLYGGFFDVLAQLASRISPLGVPETRHLFNLLFGVLCVLGAFKLGSYLAGRRAGFLSALFVILTPAFYGHAFNNPKDVPFAALFIWSLNYIVRSIAHFPYVPGSLLVKLGIAIGLALGVRVGGVLLLGYFGLAFCLWAVARYRLRTAASLAAPAPPFGRALATFAVRTLGMCVIAYAVMLVWWPRAQVEPIRHPLRALWRTAHFNWPHPVFFEGRNISAMELPWYYISKWLLISLPEFYFLSLAAGLVLAGAAVTGGYARVSRLVRNRFLECTILLTSILFPIAFAAVSGTVLYDSWRQMLFVLPSLAVAAALSLDRLLESTRWRPAVVAVAAACLLSMAATVVDMVQLHPYQTVFFNRLFAGGVQRGALSYETDYWGNSYKEGVEWIGRNYRGRPDGGRINVANCSFFFTTSYFLPSDRFRYVGNIWRMSARPDLFLATTRWRCHERMEGRVVHVVERKGVPLLYVKEVGDPRHLTRALPE
jgi:hypothetical protein